MGLASERPFTAQVNKLAKSNPDISISPSRMSRPRALPSEN